MRTVDARAAFEERLRSLGLTVADLDGPNAIQVILDFYAEVRANDVDLDADGDMLLFQWGTSKWGPAPRNFQYGITRQFIAEPGEDDEDIWQLHLVVRYPPDSENAQLRSGTRWHNAPEHIDEFANYIAGHPATAYAAAHQPLRTEIEWESV